MFGHLSSLSIRVFDKALLLHNKRSTRAVAPAERKGFLSNTLNPYQDARHMNFSRMDFSSVQQTNLRDVLRAARDGVRWACFTGSLRGPLYKATGGTRPIQTRETNGRTKRCSIRVAKRCPR